MGLALLPPGADPKPGVAKADSRPGQARRNQRALARLRTRVRALGPAAEAPDPPEVAIGERLFLETRFAQYFAAHNRGDVNRPLLVGDPLLDLTPSTGAPLPGAFAGKAMNCRSCHFVDDVAGFPGGSVRSYADFTRRSFLPLREDGRANAARNSPSLVDATLPRPSGILLHFDGEFASTEDLVRGTLTGRNFGWLAGERGAATAHVARIVREDDGSDDLGALYSGMSYRLLLTGTDARIPSDLRLPPAYTVDVASAADAAILDAVARLISAYLEPLVFSQDENGIFNGSPYDAFLAANELPATPEPGEPDLAYAARLLEAVQELSAPRFIGPADGAFELHDQPFVFGRTELAGLRLFLTAARGRRAGAGNCVACHAPPRFTDFGFHNTGITQEEYDALHGDGAFAGLAIPGLAERNDSFEAYLPPSERHPAARGRFLSAPSRDRPGEVDLGLWNVFANPDVPGPQARLIALLQPAGGDPAQALPRTIGLFKTPALRDLGQSAPYLHTGGKDRLEDVVGFYARTAQKARLGRVRNGDPALREIFLAEDEIAPLAAFLRSLDEDYQ